MIRLLSIFIVLGGITATDPPTVTGTWQLDLQADHVVPVALVLKQNGTNVTGSILLPSTQGDRREVELEGRFVDRVLTLSSTTEITMAMHGGAETKTTLTLAGTLEDDGSMSGTFMGSLKWTAEKLKERK